MAKPFKPIGAVAITVLARIAAKKAVQEQLKAQGVRVTLVKPAEIAAQAKAYLDANPHLYEEALQRAWKLGLIEQAERIDQALFDDEMRKPALTPDWRRSALFKTLKPTCGDGAKNPVAAKPLQNTGTDVKKAAMKLQRSGAYRRCDPREGHQIV